MSYYTHRLLCDILDEMRTCDTTKNYSYLKGLIEEAQCMGNKMEAALGEQKDVIRMKEERSKLKQDINKLKQKRDRLK